MLRPRASCNGVLGGWPGVHTQHSSTRPLSAGLHGQAPGQERFEQEAQQGHEGRTHLAIKEGVDHELKARILQ